MAGKARLELTWIGKENRPRLEPRVLLPDTGKSHHARQKVTDHDHFDNRLIFGDNLLALKALEAEFAGKIKCIYIDPPFNTQQALEHYEDGLEHSIWLTLMRDRLEILHRLLAKDGSLFVHIDDNELAYLMAVADEIFDRRNRIVVITFKQSSVSGPKSINPGLVSTANYIIYYAKNKAQWNPNRVFMPTERDDRYNRFIVNFDEPYSKWQLAPLKEAFAKKQGIASKDLKKQFGDSLERVITEFVLEDPKRVVRTARVAPKDINPEARAALAESSTKHGTVFRSTREDKEDYYFLDGEQLIFYSAKAKLIDGKWVTAVAASTIWDDLLSNNLHKEGGVDFPNGKKPEALLKRILELASNPGDLVLDSFAGSGTTGAVAHKMGRRWIMVELGEHCHTHIIPRLKKVIDGEDQGGITEATGWRGGGGYRYYTIAPSLLKKDRFGQWIINPEYNPEMLAAALCKIEGFVYAPSDSIYWQQGHTSVAEGAEPVSFLYVTTQTMTRPMLQKLSDEVGENRSLVVLCRSFRAKLKKGEFPNLEVKKIPKAVLSKCEWGKDDYSLEIKALPPPADDPGEPRGEAPARSQNGKAEKTIRRKVAAARSGASQMGLFAKEGS